MIVKGCKKSVQVAQTSWMTSRARRSDSTQSFANGIKVSNRTAASEIYSEFTYSESSKVRVSLCILLKEK